MSYKGPNILVLLLGLTVVTIVWVLDKIYDFILFVRDKFFPYRSEGSGKFSEE